MARCASLLYRFPHAAGVAVVDLPRPLQSVGLRSRLSHAPLGSPPACLYTTTLPLDCAGYTSRIEQSAKLRKLRSLAASNGEAESGSQPHHCNVLLEKPPSGFGVSNLEIDLLFRCSFVRCGSFRHLCRTVPGGSAHPPLDGQTLELAAARGETHLGLAPCL